jgi:short-subunit dehydrogenase
LELKGRTVLLTGATGGIGRAAALGLAGEGAKVVLFARSEAPLRALAAEIAAAGGEAHATPGDVVSRDDCARAVADGARRFGGLDALVNNAGVGYLRGVGESTDEEITRQIDVNLLGSMRMTRAALPELTRRPVSAVVNVASLAGRIAPPYYSFYSATKFALAGLSESWRRELKPSGVRVTLLVPSAVETPFLETAGRARALGWGPAGLVLRPEQVASGIIAALKRNPADLYVPFWTRPLAWLNVVLPGISDRLVNAMFRYPDGKQ